jgi:CRISPR-associated endonuclease Csy4
MNYFQDVTLIPNSDISLGFLWQKIYQQIHIALVEQKVDEQHSAIAVSFPTYGSKGFPLGNKLRVLAGEKELLENLNLMIFLSRFEDYCHIRSIQSVPTNNVAVAFIRRKVKGRARVERDMYAKAERWSAKSGESLDSCLKSLERSKPKAKSDLPFIWMESQQTKLVSPTKAMRFPLFIEKLKFENHQVGLFNCYGLSVLSSEKVATVPHF